MSTARSKVHSFLKAQKMDHRQIDLKACTQSFLSEMERGLNAQGSLEMMPTFLSGEQAVPRNKTVIALDAGGTNFRAATVYFDDTGMAVIRNFENHPMPGSRGRVGKEEFFDTMAGYVRPLIPESGDIGFCFSYPIDIYPNKDGRLTFASKEIQAEEVIGELIGQNLLNAMKAQGDRKNRKTVLLNDTVATLLAGKAAFQNRIFSSYIGFILGTGSNSCYIERNENILKRNDLDCTVTQIVNNEAGGFGRAPRGLLDELFDATTGNPGKYTFEKMISGAYLGGLCATVIRTAAEQKLFSVDVSSRLQTLKTLTTEAVSGYLWNCTEEGNVLADLCSGGDDQDRTTLSFLLTELVERAAKLSAGHLSAVVLKTGKGHDPCRPVCITVEGSVFYHMKSLKTAIEYYLKQYLQDHCHRYVEFARVENASLIGAAIAGLIN